MNNYYLVAIIINFVFERKVSEVYKYIYQSYANADLKIPLDFVFI